MKKEKKLNMHKPQSCKSSLHSHHAQSAIVFDICNNHNKDDSLRHNSNDTATWRQLPTEPRETKQEEKNLAICSINEIKKNGTPFSLHQHIHTTKQEKKMPTHTYKRGEKILGKSDEYLDIPASPSWCTVCQLHYTHLMFLEQDKKG